MRIGIAFRRATAHLESNELGATLEMTAGGRGTLHAPLRGGEVVETIDDLIAALQLARDALRREPVLGAP